LPYLTSNPYFIPEGVAIGWAGLTVMTTVTL
jgi:hypothetical protein